MQIASNHVEYDTFCQQLRLQTWRRCENFRLYLANVTWSEYLEIIRRYGSQNYADLQLQVLPYRQTDV